MQINVTYDASAAGAPAGFQQAVQAAVNALDSLITNNITVNIAFGWGEVNGQAISGGNLGESQAEFFNNLSSSFVQSVLLGFAVTPAVSAGVAALASSTYAANGNFWAPTAEAKALGYTGQGPPEDGYVGLDSTASFTFDPNNRAVPGEYDAIGLLEHEITEVLGRQIFAGQTFGSQTQDYTPFDLFRYYTAGVPDTLANGGYFSLDGQTMLKAFNAVSGGDPGDWAGSGTPDSFDAFLTRGSLESLSTVDLRVLQALGYDISYSAAGAATAPLTLAQSGALAGGASQAFNGEVALLYSHTLSQAAISYTNAGTITDSGTQSSLDVIGVEGDPSSGGQDPDGADVFSNTATGVVTISAVNAQSDAAAFFYGPNTISNDGRITATSAEADAWGVVGGSLTQSQTGVLTVQAAAGHAVGVDLAFSNFDASVTNGGSIQVSGQNSTGVVGSDFDNTATGTLYVQASNKAIGVDGSQGPIATTSNAGFIDVAGVSPIGVLSPSSFTNTGTLEVDAENEGNVGAQGALGLQSAAAVDILNSGVIKVSSPNGAEGLQIHGGAFENTGSITATNTNSYGSATGVLDQFLTPTTGLTLTNSGAVTANSGYATTGFYLSNFAGDTLVNTGTIAATGPIGTGIDLESTSGAPVTIVNAGTIGGIFSIVGHSGGYLLDLANSGTISGQVDTTLNTGNAIHNTGSIQGDVILFGGLYDGRGGALSGTLYLSSAATAYLGDDGEKVSGAGSSQPLDIVGGAGADTITGGPASDVIDGGGGDDILNGGGGYNTVSFASAPNGIKVNLVQQNAQDTGDGVKTLSNFWNITGSAYNDQIIGNSAPNVIDGGGGSDTLTGGGGADTFIMDRGVGNDVITDFNTANNIVDVSAFFSNFAAVQAAASQQGPNTVIQLGGGSLTLDNVSMGSLLAGDFSFTSLAVSAGGGGSLPQTTVTGTLANDYTATLWGVVRQFTVGAGGTTVTGGPAYANEALNGMQRIQFTDGYLAYSPTDTAGQVYRLYEATLNRAPDQEGLTNWVNALNSGTSLQTVVNGFVGSQEFQADYGAALSNTAFVTLLYQNVLHRAPDAPGLANWVGYLTSGQDTRAQVVLGFSESQENINDSAPAIEQGLWVGNADAAEVARLYDAVLGRLPDTAGLANWTSMMENGTSLQTVANGFVGSQEFQTVYGALDSTAFVTLLYQNVLHRAPDATGLNNWVTDLTSGAMSRAQVVVGFSESPEHIANLAPHIDNGIWVAG